MRRFLVCAIISFLFISVDRQSRDYLGPLRSTVYLVVSPIQFFVDIQMSSVRFIGNYFETKNNLINTVAKLHTENLLLGAKAQRYSALKRENARLRMLLGSPVVVDEEITLARILAIETKSGLKQVVVDKGSNTGAYVGQALLDLSGVLGQIISVSSYSATVLLVTDPRHALPVEINRTGLRAVAVGGEGSNNLSLLYVPADADLVTGDLIISSGLGGKFPGGYPVGKIVRFAKTPGEPFAEVIVEPSADLSRSREVLLVSSNISS